MRKFDLDPENREKVKKLQIRDDDIFLCGHPKTGNLNTYLLFI